MEKNKCERCSHIWIGRIEKEKINSCPKCKSRLWNTKRKIEVDLNESNGNFKN
jgi:Zn-finger nucleic acid-binding protein